MTQLGYLPTEPARSEVDALEGATLIFLENGVEVARLVRPASSAAIRAALDRIDSAAG